MCGVAGLMALDGRGLSADPAATALAMADTLAHRGPDGRAAWGDAAAGIGLGHRRLAIVDLTPTGAQPMHSAGGRYVIAYNGEVYNFQELRAELTARGHCFNGSSDTEVMLAACVEWGAEQAVARFVGMFAFALFDRETRTLRLVRDRLGVKPLYWAVFDGTLLFGSELRALMAHPAFCKEIDREAIAAVLRYSYVPAPATAFRGVFKLPAGSILTARAGRDPAITSYWRIAGAVTGEASPCSADEAVERLDALLRDAVRRRMVADVPLGAFLSGGTDSSTVVALMQAQSERPVRSFTIGLRDATYDESGYARDVARHVGTDHTEVVLEPAAALDLVAQVPDWFDEPFADSSQLPTYLVSRMTRQHVTVALSGDGGDELFGGYPKYQWLGRVWRYAGGLPRPLRAGLGGLAAAMPESLLRRTIAAIDPARAERVGEKARRLAAALAARNSEEAALAVAAVGLSDSRLVSGASGSLRLDPLDPPSRRLPDLEARMQAHDMATYLPDDILTKVDRCSMAVALEAREPLLDHRLVEFVWALPWAVRRGDGRPKALLRALLARYLPPALIDRPKHGFSVPLADWLRGPLRDWSEDLLAPALLSAGGLFEVTRTRAIWDRHLSGAQDNATGLWNILMVQAWARRWL
jgi:asparagine synthase (glutamine-hydrolysing)